MAVSESFRLIAVVRPSFFLVKIKQCGTSTRPERIALVLQIQRLMQDENIGKERIIDERRTGDLDIYLNS
jgi:hypothetical protein